jgi:ankyrin repeat protein|eukprot:COSAG01_NODE_4874_length_4661_cov_4.226874_6_plen_83_part_00
MPDGVRLLLEAGADPDVATSGGMTGLHFCAERGDMLCMEWLLQAQASVDTAGVDGSTPLIVAAAKAVCRRPAQLTRSPAPLN